MRLYLFDEGIDNVFSQPNSPSGRSDIVGELDSDEPLLMEVKVIDSEKGYRVNRIYEGFSQIVAYTDNFIKNFGFLVIFNMDNKQINFSHSESNGRFPASIHFNNRTIYFVVINCNNEIPASKRGKMDEITIPLNELTKGQ